MQEYDAKRGVIRAKKGDPPLLVIIANEVMLGINIGIGLTVWAIIVGVLALIGRAALELLLLF